MDYYILPRGDRFRIEFYDGDEWNGAVLCKEEELDDWVFGEWGADGSIEMTQIFQRPWDSDQIVDCFIQGLMDKAHFMADIILEKFEDEDTIPSDRILN